MIATVVHRAVAAAVALALVAAPARAGGPFAPLPLPATAPMATPTINVPGGSPLDTAPASGLDPDVTARLATAEQIVAGAPSSAALDRALALVLVVFESPDPFSRAQRDYARARSLAVLDAIANRAHAASDLALEARARDARWTLAGGPRDPQLADVLTRWAERDAAEAPGRALYLARRARLADPSDGRAADLDAKLSSNRRAWPGRVLIVAGLLAFAVGAYARNHVTAIEDDLAAHPRPGDQVSRALAQRDPYDQLGTGLLIAAPLLSLGGVTLILSGRPSFHPTSPAELPVLGAP